MTLEQEVRALRSKIAHKQAGLKTYILKGGHEKWYLQSLKGQSADFDYFLLELDRLLDNV